jgi:predicted nucleic acid-binding protein
VHHSDADYEKAGQLIARYAGQMRRKRRKPGSLDLADAMNVVVAGDKGTNLLLTADADYRVVAPLTAHAAFLLLPADLAP